MIVKVGIFGALIAGLFGLFKFFGGDSDLPSKGIEKEKMPTINFLPEINGELIHHGLYWLSYDEANEQAEWTAHQLRREDLQKDWYDRRNMFYEDDMVSTGSATLSDYRFSGYDRGHLVPSADMAWDSAAMQSTFYLSNISPQSHDFNKGIWRELEENVRFWAKKYKELYVITGPVLSKAPKGTIGQNKVSVPTAYFKVLLDVSQPEEKGIAFIIPNTISYEPLFKYATSIDNAEEITGIDFFPNMPDQDHIEELESDMNIDLWEFNKSKFQKRIEQWNK